MPWTQERVLAVAPDAASMSAGRTLAKPGPWSGTGCNESLLWGSCQGSGKKPYQVSIDLNGPAYKCSCPSRKFPCKHAIALLLLWSEGVVGDGTAADFAADWAGARSRRTASTGTAAADVSPAAAPDPAARAARRAERAAKMDAGVDEFSRWLSDLMRAGLADAMRRPDAWWEAAAARLVDAQLPGLAERVRDTAGDITHGDLAPADLLERTGVWWTMARGWTRRESLAPALQADLQTALGWPIPTAEVRAGELREGVWIVVGSHRTEIGRLAQQRTWLRPATIDGDPEFVVVLETAGPGQSLDVPQLAGARVRATLGVYPGSAPRRVLFTEPPAPEPTPAGSRLGPGTTLAAAFAGAADHVARVPWRDLYPVVLDDVALGGPDCDHLVDPNGSAVPLVADTPTKALSAVTGGRADQVFGELDGGRFRVLTVLADGEVTPL
ncbi:SWIM zinc finger domain-containing protein [Gordonia sp. (in: high G+C Gram-positive bacteria)]|uniref:SWIM zinc finger family protein n=1 Tax=Gordonia sp. (in: high G+C Gram-positive bacteria) TaxID=84139 RepID=UPI0025B8AD76|nr:SWIM zinc finger family protein [Gordonia sp. (in: high G+C Gram-positive bacteria)]